MRMSRIKGIALAMAVLVGTGSLFAAGQGEAGATAKKVINFWYWDQNGDEPYKTLVQEFESKNPDIKITMSVIPWADYWTKLQIALPTGTGPDVFWLNHPNAVSYIPTGLLMDLEGAAGEIQFDNFNKNFYSPFMMNGKRYGVPIFYDSVILYYNKALFDKAGVSYPNSDWTWKEYLDAAGKLTIKQDGKTIQYGTIADPDAQSGSSNLILQNGGRMYSADRMLCAVDSPEAREAVQFDLDLIYKYGYSPKVQEMRELTKANMFQSGMVAMVANHTGILKQFAEVLGKDMGIAPLPKGKQRASIYHNLGYVASAKTKNPQEVVKFMAFLASKRHADVLSKVWAPCYNGGTAMFYSVYDWLDTRYITEAIEYGYPLPIAGKNAGPIYTKLNNEMEKVYMSATVGTSLATVVQTINAEIVK